MAGELGSGGYLLDTHVWLWLMTGDESQLAKASFQRMKTAASQDTLVVSDMSVWEVGLKHATGKLQLAPTLDDWLARAGRSPGIAYLPVDRESLLLSTRLPGSFHRDAVDRVLLATAALHGLTLATADEVIIEYGKRTPGFSVMDVTR